MIYREYEERAKELRDYFAPGKKVKLAAIDVWMMSINIRDEPHPDDEVIAPSQLPVISCVYATKGGTLMDICIEWADLDALYIMNLDDI